MVVTVFQSTRQTEPDQPSLNATLSPATISWTPPWEGTGNYRVTSAVALSAGQITAIQNALDTAPAISPELRAQSAIDRMDIPTKALLLALIDQLNVIRAALPSPLGAITPAQALAAVRAKAGTL